MCVVVWCGVTQELVSDNERLRLSASAARESAARQSDELKRLQRDNARLSPALVGGTQACPSSLPSCLPPGRGSNDFFQRQQQLELTSIVACMTVLIDA